jgi:prevent-host-death family protein
MMQAILWRRAEPMPKITAQDFRRHFGRYQDAALRGPVEITRRGRGNVILVSADEYHRLKSRDRRAYRAEELPDALLEAIAKSKMAPRHRKLDRLLDPD